MNLDRIWASFYGALALADVAAHEGGLTNFFMPEHDPRPSLEDLDARLRKARGDISEDGESNGSGTPPSGIGMAFRVGTELVAGVAVGTGIGWLLDQWLGTRPWLMVVFFFIGAAAGMLNVYRTAAGFGLAVGYRAPGQDQPEDPKDKDPEDKGPED